MFKFFYFFTGIHNSTNNETISTTESVANNMNNCCSAKNVNQCNQTSTGNNNTNQFLEQENFELEKIIENALDLEEELHYKNTLNSVLNNPILDATNSQCFKDNNNETLENPVIKKIKLDDDSKCVTSENAGPSEKIFQNSPSIHRSNASNCFEFPKQYDTVLNSDKALNDQNDSRKCEDIITYEDKKDLMNKLNDYYAKQFNRYLISKKKLNYNSAFQNKTVQFNNQQLTNLDLFLDFCREILSYYKSAFDKAKNEKISISKKVIFFGKIDKEFISKLIETKKLYCWRKKSLNKSIERRIRNIENSFFFKESSCESIKELIVECNMFIKEVVKYFMSFNFTVYLTKENLKFIYNECEDIIQKFTNISQAVQMESIFAIIKMLIGRLERSWDFLGKINRNLIMFFNSVTRLSTDIKWLISPLKDIMDSIDKECKCRESN